MKAKVLLAALLLGAALPGCSTHGNADVASEAVEKFHHNLDQGLYQSILLDADADYKSNTFNSTYLQKTHEIGGKVKSTIGGRVGSQSFSEEAQITMIYKTDLENYRASANFLCGVRDGKAKLKFYEVKGLPGVTLD